MNRHNLKNTIAFLILPLILLVIPGMTKDPYLFHILIMVGINVILCASLRLVIMTGVWNLGQIAFYAIGAYVVSLLMVYYGLSFWLVLPLAGIAAAVVALGFGYLAMRVKGMYFVMLSLAFVEMIRLTIINVPFLSRYHVLNVPPPNPIIFPGLLRVEFISKVPYYYLILALVIIILAVLYRIERSRMGEIFKSIAAHEPLCQSIGINTTKYTVLAFVICSFFAGIAGGFYAPYLTLIAPRSFNMLASVMIFVPLIVGGVGSFWGPVIGATLLTVLPEILRGAVIYEPMIFAVILLLIVFFLPGGLTSLPGVIRSRMAKSESR